MGRDAPKRAALLGVLVNAALAIAKLTASWGTDYFLLAKMDGKWMIMQVLWQTPMAE